MERQNVSQTAGVQRSQPVEPVGQKAGVDWVWKVKHGLLAQAKFTTSLPPSRITFARTYVMIAIGNTLLSLDLFEELFACDLSACRGACCVEGESGAPLAPEELAEIDHVFEIVKPRLRPEGLAVIEERGRYEKDDDGDWVTPIIDGMECVYATFDTDGTAKCAFDQAFRAGEIDFQKPISCHLYPIRVKELRDFTALNYHRWPICDGARSCGARLNTTIVEFCREALVRRFGEDWYEEALQVLDEWRKQKTETGTGTGTGGELGSQTGTETGTAAE